MALDHHAIARTTAVGLRIVIILVLLSAIVFLGIPGTNAFSHVLQKLGHSLIFAIIAWLTFSVLCTVMPPRDGPDIVRYIAALGITVGLGAATEIAQAFVHRDPSLIDVLRDAGGAAAALTGRCAIEWPSHWPPGLVKFRLICAGGAIVLVAAILAPMALCLAAYAHRNLASPSLAQFDSPLDLYFVSQIDAGGGRVSEPKRWALGAREKALEIRLISYPYSAVTLEEPFPDWRGRSPLAFDLTNPGPAPLQLTVSVYDGRRELGYQDRFNRDFTAPAGVRMVFAIPLRDIQGAPAGPPLDMGHIARVVLVRSGSSESNTLLLTRVWLQ